MFEGIRSLPGTSFCQDGEVYSYEKDYTFFENPVHLSSNSEQFFSHFDLFFGGFRAEPSGEARPAFQVWIHNEDPGSQGEHRLYQDRELIYRTDVYIDIFLFLEWQICGMITKTDRYLLLHAGLSAREGKGILIAGPSGAGKTTLVAGLALRGYDYITDEMVIVEPAGAGILPFPRTLNIKEEALSDSPSLLAGLKKRNYGQKEPYLGGLWFVKADPGQGVSRIRTVFFPIYDNTGKPEIEEISRGQGVFLLTRNTFNLHRFRQQGIDLLIDLSKEARFYKIHTGDLEKTLNLMEQTGRQE